MTGLSPRDTKVLAYLQRSVSDTFCPTFRQIGEACGLPSTGQVAATLDSLQGKGWVKRHPHMRRAIELTDPLAGKSTDELQALRRRIDTVLASR